MDKINKEDKIKELEKLNEFMNTKKEILLAKYNELAEDDEKITLEQLNVMTKEELKTPFSDTDDVKSSIDKIYNTMKRKELRDNK
jgi:molybdopterin converting factor small subunit